MGWIRVWLLLFLLVVLSCENGEEKSFALRIRSTGQVFESVLLRVSYPEGFFQERRAGPFPPGEIVEFKLDLPDGKERLVEVFLYIGGKPAYYRALFLESLRKEDRIVVELLPSSINLEGLEMRSEGFRKSPVSPELFSQDLYSHNGLYEGYLVGSYGAYRVGGELHFRLVEDDRMVFEKEVTLKVKSDRRLFVEGSFRGTLEGEQELKTRSSLISPEDEALLVSLGESSGWFLLGKVDQKLHEWKGFCNPEGEHCKSYRLSYPSSMELLPPLGEYRGIRFTAGWVEEESIRVLNLPEIKHYAGIRLHREAACRLWGYAYKELKEREERLSLKEANLPVPSESGWLFWSEDGLFRAEAYCERGTTLAVPYLEDKSLWVEKREGEHSLARKIKLSELSRWQEPEEKIESLKVENRRDHIFVSWKTVGNFSHCELELWNSELRLFVNKINPPRSHLKIGLFRLTEELFKEEPQARLRCYFEDGYAEMRKEKPALLTQGKKALYL